MTPQRHHIKFSCSRSRSRVRATSQNTGLPSALWSHANFEVALSRALQVREATEGHESAKSSGKKGKKEIQEKEPDSSERARGRTRDRHGDGEGGKKRNRVIRNHSCIIVYSF